jgi:hypothetical protein
MSVITTKKPFEEVVSKIESGKNLSTLVVGCDKCAKISKTGGTEETLEMIRLLKERGIKVFEKNGLPYALEDGLCDPKAVSKWASNLSESDTNSLQLLVLSCGAGLKCLRDNLKKVRIIAGLNTLGPGVKGELACLSCGDCTFGDEGCRMTKIVEIQSNYLSKSYKESRSKE